MPSFVKNALGQFVAVNPQPVKSSVVAIAPVHVKSQGHKKMVGFTKIIGGKLVFEKYVKSKHKMRVPPGWGLDVETWNMYLKKTVEEVHLLNTETGTRYILRAGKVIPDAFKFNRGYGDQYGIADRYWEIHLDGGA